MKIKKLFQTFAALLVGGVTAQAAQVTVSTAIGDGVTPTAVTWYATNEYLLDRVIYVQSNAVLTVEAGTVVKGKTNVTVLQNGFNNVQLSALWVTRGGKLYATGTVSKPIIFTAEGDDLNGNYSGLAKGLWGGVVLLGKATLNSAKDLNGDVANPVYEVFEGTTGAGTIPEHVFGGNQDNDSSGALQYVSIRHPGKLFAPAEEINGLTLGGVGRGTLLDHVEVFSSDDDGFEWWGGTVNSKYLVASFCIDDDFDTDQGYTGTNQFWFGLKPPTFGTSDSRGWETDGEINQDGVVELPISNWRAYNVTLIGRGKTNTSFGGGVAWNLRDEAAPEMYNSIVTEFNQGLLLDNDGMIYATNGPAGVWNTIWNVTDQANNNGDFFFTTASFSNTVQNPLLGAISYTNNGVLNPRPAAGSPAFTNVLAGAPMAVAYRGAFSGVDDDWADGWTALSSQGYLAPAGTPVTVTVSSNIGDGVTPTAVTWYAANEYLLDRVIYVQSNAVLTVEAGTVVKGKTNVTVLQNGFNNVQLSALWVTRGGKLYATGTVSKPIIFTAEGDDLNGNYSGLAKGLWGGVVLLGKATLNSAKDLNGDVANPVYEVFEGTTGAGTIPEHVFGGNQDNDSSGALQYVSIRHPGKLFAPAEEINGLTMGGVGRGTLLDHVEVFSSDDDGFEWWGGTVNSKYLVASFCIDDDFDTDQGYTGTNQFWFGLKPPTFGTSDSRGWETDGEINQDGVVELPISNWRAYNVTLIGRGKTNTSFGGGVAWNLRDEAAPEMYNSIVTEFNQGLLLDNDGMIYATNGPAGVWNTIWNVTDQANNNGDFFFTTASFSNTVQNPLLVSISYTNNGMLNPRPQAGSPAFTNVLAGAPMAVAYRGAFSANDNWADCWTALSSLGYLVPASPELDIELVNGNVEVSWLALPGAAYQLQTNAPLTGVWGNSGSAMVSASGGIITVTNAASLTEEYYRVVLTK